MPLPANAPYSGGSSPGAEICYVDGDMTVAWPVTLPMVSTPFQGDTILGRNDIILLSSAEEYVTIPVGSGYNIQPAAANQTAIVIEQEFIAAEAFYVPLPLNTLYDTDWAVGWAGTYSNLGDAVLVEEGPLQDMGGGLVKFKRTYAVVPPTRSVPGTYSYQFPGLSFDDGAYRPSFVKVVACRTQYDFFLWDPADISAIPLWPGADAYNRSRLDETTGMNPDGLIFQEQKYYAEAANAVANNIFLPQDAQLANPSDPSDPTTGTIPTMSQYLGWITGSGTSNNLPGEIVAVPSSLEQWKGNIYMRKTLFVLAL